MRNLYDEIAFYASQVAQAQKDVFELRDQLAKAQAEIAELKKK